MWTTEVIRGGKESFNFRSVTVHDDDDDDDDCRKVLDRVYSTHSKFKDWSDRILACVLARVSLEFYGRLTRPCFVFFSDATKSTNLRKL